MKSNSVYIFITASLIFLFSTSVHSQRWGEDEHWGVQIGLTATLGTHVNRIGLKIQGYYTYKFIQINGGNHLRFNAESIGNRKNFITQRLNAGIVFMTGEPTIEPHLLLDGVNHQTRYEYALGYNYLWYFDNIGTTQQAGGFGLHLHQFSIYIENDILAGQGKDRFRTSFAAVGFHNDFFNLMLNTLLWTGETGGVVRVNQFSEKYPGGYKDISTLPYGKTSHGIVSISLDYSLFYGNTISTNIGIDSENVRDLLQNKFMHNKVFVPKPLRTPNPHYPMIDQKGFPAKSKDDIRPAQFFFQVGLNRSLSY